MLDTKHTDYMNQFSHENKSIIPTLEQELLEETNSNKQKVLVKKINALKPMFVKIACRTGKNLRVDKNVVKVFTLIVTENALLISPQS